MGKIKDKLREYNRSKNFLDTICKAHFDATAPKGRSYVGWRLSDEHPNCVGIGYDFYDWRNQYENGDEIIPMDVLIEFSKQYKNDN